uniref:Flavodoxin n=1 Tax=Candidatus Caldatribacterium saccharofermentans TaxID=1454753 RepID=A0A7V4WL98_9BACT
MVKSLIVVVSVHHGNTRRVAQAIGEVLESQIREPEELAPEDLAAFDLVGFGSGIYFGKFHERLVAFVERLSCGQGQKVFVFSTSGLGRASANRPLEELLRQKGFAVLGSFTCKGYDTFGVLRVFGGINRGKPGEKELGKARKFARFLRILVAEGGENHA